MREGSLVKIEDIGPLAVVVQGGRNMVKLELEGEQFWIQTSLTGSVNNIENWAELPKAPRNGHFIVVSIDPRYKDKPISFFKGGEPSGSTDKATDEDLFWVLRVDDTKQFSFKSGEDTIAELDCSGLTLK